MSIYKPAIKKNNEGSFFAVVVRVESDGEERVIHGYRGRHFKSEKAALKSTNTHISKYCA